MPTTPDNAATPEGMFELASRIFQGLPESGDVILNREEASGQRSFATSDTLPTHTRPEDRALLEQGGVVFGDVVPGDDLFTYVTLPAGWHKVPRDHSMWSNLVDEKGRVRASIFYKAAFYDRSAYLTIYPRFGVRQTYGGNQITNNTVTAKVVDGDSTIFTSQTYNIATIYEGNSRHKTAECQSQEDKACNEALSWLDEHYPEWESKSAYRD